MIKKVKIKNLMSWSGVHEVEYKEGLILFDGEYGVGKSSLLVDSLDLVFSGKARTKLQDLITRGKNEMQVEVFMDIKGIEYKFLFYYKKKGEEEGKNGKMKKVSAKTIWESYQFIENEWKKIEESPESILGVDYELVAKKTFLIGQFDLDTFSKAGPSEKYDIIAEAFQISKLFAIGEKAKEKIKYLTSNKISLEENFSNIDTSEFDKKDSLKKEIEEINKKIKKEEELEEKIRKKRELLVEKIKEKNRLEELKEELKYKKETKKEIEKIDVKKLEKEIKELKNKIEKSKNPLIPKLQDEINIQKTKIDFIKEKIENKKEEIKNENIIEINNINNGMEQVLKELNNFSLYQNKEVLNSIKENEDFYKKIKIENIEEKENKINKDIESIKININLKENEINRNQKLIENIEKIKDSNCPTCHRPLSKEDKETIIKNTNSIIEKIKKELEEERKKLEKNNKEFEEINLNKQRYSLYQDFLKIEELRKKGKELKSQKEKLVIKMKEKAEKEINKLKEELEKEEKTLIDKNKKLEEELKKDNTQKLEEELDKLNKKVYLVKGSYYNLENLKNFKIEIETLIKNLEKEIEKIEKNIKNFDFTQKIEDLDQKINEKRLKINEYREFLIENNNRLSKIEQNEENYKKVESQIKEINNKISVLEKIQMVFGRKGEPRTILQNYIIPNLENNINNILEETTDGYYQVEFKLSNETLDGRESKKNVFNIIVYQQGVDQTYDTLSGGERTNINYAIRLGITITLNDILGEKISDFLVLDEVFRGDLDSENGGEALVNSVIRTKESGRFKQIFIITHTDYIKEKLEDNSQIIKIEKRGKYSNLIE